MKRYLWLLVGTMLAGAALLGVGRSRGPARHGDPEPPSPRDTTLTFTAGAHGMDPARSDVPLGSRVHLEIGGSESETLRVTLGGYEDRVSLTIAPGSTGRVTFLADRPGEDLPWRIDGQPSGRLSVTGSHLVEGHR